MPTRVRKSTSASRARRGTRPKAKLNGRSGTAKVGKAAGALTAVTVAAKEWKDQAVKAGRAAGRKMNMKTAAAGAAAVTAVVATGLFLRRKKK